MFDPFGIMILYCGDVLFFRMVKFEVVVIIKNINLSNKTKQELKRNYDRKNKLKGLKKEELNKKNIYKGSYKENSN